MYNLFLTGLVFALAYLAMQIPIWKYQQTKETLQAEVKTLTAEAESSLQLIDNLNQRHQSLENLIDYKSKIHTMADILLELTNLAPDDTWLKSFERVDSKLVLRGESKQTSTFMERIELSPMFQNISSVSPTVVIPGSLYERFHLSATLSNRASK